LLQTLAARGLDLAVTRRLEAGEVPVQIVDRASLPAIAVEDDSTARRRPPRARERAVIPTHPFLMRYSEMPYRRGGLVIRALSWLLAAMLAFPGSVLAASPYIGQTSRSIKALSDQEVADYLAGKGMGLARRPSSMAIPGRRMFSSSRHNWSFRPRKRPRRRPSSSVCKRAPSTVASA
jgi:hypothetical protein